MRIRIVICVDIEKDTPEEAYSELYDRMGRIAKGDMLEWESTDEWFGSDGEPMDERAVSEARMRVLADKGGVWTRAISGSRRTTPLRGSENHGK